MTIKLSPFKSLLIATTIVFLLIGTGVGSNDIRIHDTFFILGSFTKWSFILISAVFISALILSVITRFRNKIFIKTFIFSFLLMVCFSMYLFSWLFVNQNH